MLRALVSEARRRMSLRLLYRTMGERDPYVRSVHFGFTRDPNTSAGI
jgi:hypothetical protein